MNVVTVHDPGTCAVPVIDTEFIWFYKIAGGRKLATALDDRLLTLCIAPPVVEFIDTEVDARKDDCENTSSCARFRWSRDFAQKQACCI